MTDELMNHYDVVVVGGGAAGLSGALTLARARRSVVVIDGGQPRNAPAEGVHGFLGSDGVSPAELLERGRQEVRRYGGQLVRGEVTAAVHEGDGFVLTLADGTPVGARRLLVTTGLTDVLPDVAGLAERWGREVLHCPYCHGWEVRDRAIGVLGSGPMSVHQALLFRQWSDDVTYVSHTAPPNAEQAEQLVARGIRVVDATVTRLVVEDGRLAGLGLDDGRTIAVDAVVVSTRMEARAGFLADLGLEPADHPAGVGRHVVSDATGRTDIPGVWLAGNVTDLAAQVVSAAAAGTSAAAQINADLVGEETRRAVDVHRARFALGAGGRDG